MIHFVLLFNDPYRALLLKTNKKCHFFFTSLLQFTGITETTITIFYLH